MAIAVVEGELCQSPQVSRPSSLSNSRAAFRLSCKRPWATACRAFPNSPPCSHLAVQIPTVGTYLQSAQPTPLLTLQGRHLLCRKSTGTSVVRSTSSSPSKMLVLTYLTDSTIAYDHAWVSAVVYKEMGESWQRSPAGAADRRSQPTFQRLDVGVHLDDRESKWAVQEVAFRS